MARVVSVNRADKTIVTGCSGPAIIRGRAIGWNLIMDESVIWDFIFENHGQGPVRFYQCKPGGFPNTGGNYCIVDVLDRTVDKKIDNNDQFFWAEVQNENGEWVPANGGEGHSDATFVNNNNACIMSWNAGGLRKLVVAAR
jgi:hypothetical protein